MVNKADWGSEKSDRPVKKTFEDFWNLYKAKIITQDYAVNRGKKRDGYGFM